MAGNKYRPPFDVGEGKGKPSGGVLVSETSIRADQKGMIWKI